MITVGIRQNPQTHKSSPETKWPLTSREASKQIAKAAAGGAALPYMLQRGQKERAHALPRAAFGSQRFRDGRDLAAAQQRLAFLYGSYRRRGR